MNALGDTVVAFPGRKPQQIGFTREELETSITGGGFEILDSWQPEGGDSAFVIARKSRDSSDE